MNKNVYESYNIQYSPIKKEYNDLQRINNTKKIKIYGSRKLLTVSK